MSIQSTAKRLFITLGMAAATWAVLAGSAAAALKCEELTARRSCLDGNPRTVNVQGGSVAIPPPIQPGMPATPCWSWSRTFQCIETNPVLRCDSGQPYATVSQTCSLTDAVTKSSVQINGVNFITSADYTYRCAYGEWGVSGGVTIPSNKDCPVLKETVRESEFVGNLAVAEERKRDYVCYDPPVTTCSDTCKIPSKDAQGNVTYSDGACPTIVSSCSLTTEQCVVKPPSVTGGLPTNTVGPDGRCVSTVANYLCKTAETPRCLTEPGCALIKSTPSAIQVNGFATTEEQVYQCSREERTCTEKKLVNSCVSANAWGWDELNHRVVSGEGLGEANSAMAKVEGIREGTKENDLHIFSGRNLRCRYPVGNFLNTALIGMGTLALAAATGGASLVVAGQVITATQAAVAVTALSALSEAPDTKAFGSDCCKDYVIEGSEKWYKLGKCNADEVRLGVARSKSLAKQIGGDYCSKRSGFPIKMCKEKTKSYCAFDDMLAMVVNEQGRAQLDAMASADSQTVTTSNEISLAMFAPYVEQSSYAGMNTGSWKQVTKVGDSQLWYWQYPGYCRTPALQSKAFDIYNNTINKIADTKGIQPSLLTPVEAKKILDAAAAVPDFQECSSVAGEMTFMSCSRLDDACDMFKLPIAPSGVESDLTGETVNKSDPAWAMQPVRSFYSPNEPGVSGVMASNSAFAAVTSSLSAYITSTGSCRVDGDCLFKFSATAKSGQVASTGGRRRVTEEISFPLYTVEQLSAHPPVGYVPSTGPLSMDSYMADPNRGIGLPVVVGEQRFIFRPNLISRVMKTQPHQQVLLEWSAGLLTSNSAAPYTPLLVPTSSVSKKEYSTPTGNHKFYLSGGCDVAASWCKYEIAVDVEIPRHPWGTAQQPRCWGFTVEQLAALDFNKMDLSRWLNTLDFGEQTVAGGEALAAQTTATAQTFYGALKTGGSVPLPEKGVVALLISPDKLPQLSAPPHEAYLVTVAVPDSWPEVTQNLSHNPVTSVSVNWGRNSTWESMPKDGALRVFKASHDFGDAPVGTYKVTVKLQTTHDGEQTLTGTLSIAPYNGQRPVVKGGLDLTSPGIQANTRSTYAPSNPDGKMSQSEAALQSVSPGMQNLYKSQGDAVGAPPAKP